MVINVVTIRKYYNLQHYPIIMLENWCENVDKYRAFSTLSIDLSKTFDCLPHEVLIAKLHLYGFHADKSLNLMYDYLTNKKQSVKVGGT